MNLRTVGNLLLDEKIFLHESFTHPVTKETAAPIKLIFPLILDTMLIAEKRKIKSAPLRNHQVHGSKYRAQVTLTGTVDQIFTLPANFFTDVQYSPKGK